MPRSDEYIQVKAGRNSSVPSWNIFAAGRVTDTPLLNRLCRGESMIRPGATFGCLRHSFMTTPQLIVLKHGLVLFDVDAAAPHDPDSGGHHADDKREQT